MATTSFLTPSAIAQIDSVNNITNRPSIQWSFDNANIGESSPASTLGTLYTMSGFWQEKFYSETSQLVCTDFGIPDLGTIAGIELELDVHRVARVQDLIVQLTLNGDIIGENRASNINPVQSDTYTSEVTVPLHPIDDYNIYGGPDDMWGTTLSNIDITDPSFGVVLSFRSNMIYPHNDVVYLNQVALRITYA